MNRLFCRAFLVVAVLAGAQAARAAVFVYDALLDGPSESPPNASPGTGYTQVTYDSVLKTLRVEAYFSGLIGTTTAAHIHAPTTVAGTGTAGVATQTPSFSGFPLGVTSGTMDTTFDLTLASSWNGSYITANGGTPAGAEAAFASALAAGKAYFNIHSTAFPGGEIRGFLVVPEPSGLILLALPALLVARRRRLG